MITICNYEIYNNCEIGEENIIHAGANIGSDGLGFAHDSKGNYQKMGRNLKILKIQNVQRRKF